ALLFFLTRVTGRVLGVKPSRAAFYELAVDLEVPHPDIRNDAPVLIDVARCQNDVLPPHEIDELQLRLPTIRLIALGSIDIGETHVHLSTAHPNSQRIAVTDPRERTVEYSLIARFRRPQCRGGYRRALRMAMPFARRFIEVTALAIDLPRVCIRQRERQKHRE